MEAGKPLNSFDRFLLRYSSAIDDIDMFLAPASTLAAWHHNKTIKDIGFAAVALDLLVLKTPFVIMYTARTRDYKSPLAWLGWEVLAHAIPYDGGCLSIRRNYEHDTFAHYGVENRKELKEMAKAP
jgi:hypothetical protein